MPKVEFHRYAWKCPKCGWWNRVSYRPIGNTKRKCTNKICKHKVQVRIVEGTRVIMEKRIVEVEGVLGK